MADYVIGDVQGCYDPLQRLLERIDFNEHQDRLWFVGDLVNRGPQSLAVLRFIKRLPHKPRITLGNHDLHLLNRLFGETNKVNADDTLVEIIRAPDRDELGHWLRKQNILIYDEALNIVMTHAGIAPMWDLPQAQQLAEELEQVLWGEHYQEFLTHMYGNEPDIWSFNLTGTTRLRVICNYFTRMRFCDHQGRLCFRYKGSIKEAPAALYPWFEVPHRHEIPVDIVFGHWAALLGQCSLPRIYAIDTGCLWGGELTALRLQDRQRFTVPGLVVN
ncbi:symmetrical bis(5'-nucleosyl)-tetraphosphatase [Legionella oakridgensis]|uniref:Bis(5'-nucleosyl)-tetraphosphatase, symmetrical n=2 Tax=Legionella oakridgensis TaxID=29423 RepID=W0BCW7_9GAMM|nr:symmetrical bis(5'-nucleosyl)-tetraphosphatase [Legionella oakridgensis]AHE68358.1 bis5''-nucleosyl-tetraphosphatase symmetrical [Legionella oakridgensis ATCC 33761 = DSM 21215]ETO92167.1 Bis(5''nucleosyl)-tetraphosphatase, ApaH [Legionella oakridgensis RV-2-2007]KTD38972.1 bis(5'-nucleosyl)-tetraphosphatase [Legionella oakridgensis]STY21300.1 bis(5'-nucleosyl)-tetraphosphatase [Legionella longbeachae]